MYCFKISIFVYYLYNINNYFFKDLHLNEIKHLRYISFIYLYLFIPPDIRGDENTDKLSLSTKGKPMNINLVAQKTTSVKVFDFDASRDLQNQRHFSDNDMRFAKFHTKHFLL